MIMKKKYLLLIFFYATFLCHSQCYTNFSGGEAHFVSKKTDGTLWGWGWGDWGQLGTANYYEFIPIQIGTGNDWQVIKSGRLSTFAIKNNGTLWGTGSNSQGSLGIGSSAINSYAFIQIGSDNNWAKIAPADFFTIALKTNGTLWGWGQNDSYQMGNGTCCSNQLTPIQIGTDTDWKDIAALHGRTGFALKNNGTLWGWGANGSGILVAGSLTQSRPIPFQLSNDTDWASIHLGIGHILALKNNGTLWSWGAGDYGQLGYDLIASDTPTQVGTDTWKSVTGGLSTSFGVKTNGTLWAWGKNDNGQLGIGGTANQTAPVQIGTDSNWTTVSTGYNTTFATKMDDTVWVWGSNNVGEAGTGNTNLITVPTLLANTCAALKIDNFNSFPVFSINPNPTQGQIILSFKQAVENTTVTILDLTGKKLQQHQITNITNSCSIDIQNLLSGIYMVIIKDGEDRISNQKLIVQ